MTPGNTADHWYAAVLQYRPGIRTSWFWRQMVAASAVTSGHAALRVGRWRLSWCSALAQYDVYTAAANISPSLHQDMESGSEGSSYYNIYLQSFYCLYIL